MCLRALIKEVAVVSVLVVEEEAVVLNHVGDSN